MSKPLKLPEWDTNKVNTLEPDQDHKDDGWLAPDGVPEKPPFQYFNFWQNNVYDWIAFMGDNDVVLVKVDTDTLEASRINTLTDSGTYDLPLANTVEAGTMIMILLEDKFSEETPLVQATGLDTITDINGADADGEILFNALQSTVVRLISDGVSDWRM